MRSLTLKKKAKEIKKKQKYLKKTKKLYKQTLKSKKEREKLLSHAAITNNTSRVAYLIKIITVYKKIIFKYIKTEKLVIQLK